MKTVLITGGSRGIGKCIAENLAKEGYNVVLNYNKSEKQAKQIKKDLEEQGINIEICKADVSKREEVKKMVEYIINKYGKIDVLVNNAGISFVKMFTEMDKTVDRENGLFGEKSQYVDTFKSIVYQQLGHDLASNPRSSIGMASQIYKQMEKYVGQ